MLRSIVLELEGDQELVKNKFLGYYSYTFFINQLKKIDQKKASLFHQKNTKKPFSLSAPFLTNERIFLRVNLLTDEIFSLFLSSLFETKEITIKEKFILKKVHLTPNEKYLPRTINHLIKTYPNEQKITNDRFVIKTLSPFLFKTGADYEIIPNFNLINHSFEKKQKEIYGEIKYRLPAFKITALDLKSRSVNLEPFSEFIGMAGEIKIKIKDNLADLFALEYFGLGMKTTMGLGGISIIRLIE